MACKDHSSYCLNIDCVKYFLWTVPLLLVTHVVNGATVQRLKSSQVLCSELWQRLNISYYVQMYEE
jgi:hypothetical protein